MTGPLSVVVDAIKVIDDDHSMAHGIVEETQSEVVVRLRWSAETARTIGRRMRDRLQEELFLVAWDDVITLMPPIEECPACTEAEACSYHTYLVGASTAYWPLLATEPGDEVYLAYVLLHECPTCADGH